MQAAARGQPHGCRQGNLLNQKLAVDSATLPPEGHCPGLGQQLLQLLCTLQVPLGAK
jgi:hypothetical protein